MGSKVGWKIFFFITVLYSLAALASAVDAFKYQYEITLIDYFKWPSLLLLSCLYMLAVYGYCWKKYFFPALFWYALMWLSLAMMVVECVAVLLEDGVSAGEKSFLIIGAVLFLSLISRVLYLYSSEIRSVREMN